MYSNTNFLIHLYIVCGMYWWMAQWHMESLMGVWSWMVLSIEPEFSAGIKNFTWQSDKLHLIKFNNALSVSLYILFEMMDLHYAQYFSVVIRLCVEMERGTCVWMLSEKHPEAIDCIMNNYLIMLVKVNSIIFQKIRTVFPKDILWAQNR